MEDLREQVNGLSKIVVDLTELRSAEQSEQKGHSLQPFQEDFLTDPLFDTPIRHCSNECPSTWNSSLAIQEPLVNHDSSATTITNRSPAVLPLSQANTCNRPIQLRSPLSTINVNQGQIRYRINGPPDKQRWKVEAMVLMGSELMTSGMAYVDVLFTDRELGNGNTAEWGKIEFPVVHYMTKKSPVFQEQCRGKRRTVLRRLQKQTNF